MNTLINMNILQIAQIVHEANRVLCKQHGDNSQVPWEDAPGWQKDSAVTGIMYRKLKPGAPISSQHDAWMSDKIDSGWTYGEVKDPEARTHPCILPFDMLPPEQQAKDALFCGIVDALLPYIK